MGDSSEEDKKYQAYLLLFKKKNRLQELDELEKDL